MYYYDSELKENNIKHILSITLKKQTFPEFNHK